jgi:hypothetical protein
VDRKEVADREMGPKLVLVIVLLGAVALDWLASAEQGDESSVSPLKPNRIEKRVVGLYAKKEIVKDEYLIDDVLQLKIESPCNLQSQELLEDACDVKLEMESLKNKCTCSLKKYRDRCRSTPVLVLKENFNAYLNENMKPLIEVSDEAERRGDDRHSSIEEWVTQLGIVGQSKFYTICEQFRRDSLSTANHFGFNIEYVLKEDSSEWKYFQYANKYCETIVGVIKQARKENKLTLEDAEEMLKSQSLGRDAVAEILARLDKNQKIDGVRVGELLFSDQNICNVENQVRRVNNCEIIETQSLKNYCEDLVERVKQKCLKMKRDLLPTYATPGLEDIANELAGIWRDARDKNTDRVTAFQRMVAKRKPDFFDAVERECESFFEHHEKVKKLFGIDIMWFRNFSSYYYLYYAGLHCGSALDAIENKRRRKSLWRKMPGVGGCLWP